MRIWISAVWVALPLIFVLDVFRSVPLLTANASQPIAGLNIAPFAASCIVSAHETSAYCPEIVAGAMDGVPTVTRRDQRSLGVVPDTLELLANDGMTMICVRQEMSLARNTLRRKSFCQTFAEKRHLK
jgi:hypothetical protein